MRDGEGVGGLRWVCFVQKLSFGLGKRLKEWDSVILFEVSQYVGPIESCQYYSSWWAHSGNIGKPEKIIMRFQKIVPELIQSDNLKNYNFGFPMLPECVYQLPYDDHHLYID